MAIRLLYKSLTKWLSLLSCILTFKPRKLILSFDVSYVNLRLLLKLLRFSRNFLSSSSLWFHIKNIIYISKPHKRLPFLRFWKFGLYLIHVNACIRESKFSTNCCYRNLLLKLPIKLKDIILENKFCDFNYIINR